MLLPPLSFAVFGILTPLIARRFGLEGTLIASPITLAEHLGERRVVGRIAVAQ